MYVNFLTSWSSIDEVVIGAEVPKGSNKFIEGDGISYLSWMMLFDSLAYLPNNILTKVDRAAMSVGLEVRVPMLDPDLINFSWQIPDSMKIRDGQAKWLLRQVLYRHLPREMIDRPKMGFGVPVGEWLRGPLRDWAEALISSPRLSREGFLNANLIQARWKEHLEGSRNWQDHIWNVLMFQAWLEKNRD